MPRLALPARPPSPRHSRPAQGRTRRSLLRPFGAAALALALAAIGLPLSSRGARQAEGWVQHTLEVLLRAEQLLGALRDAETGQRGYLLTLDPAYLAPYEAGRAAVRERLAELRQLTADNPTQGERLAPLEAVVAAKLEELARTVDLSRSGQHAAALGTMRTHEGRHLMLQVRELLDAVWAEEERLLGARRREAAAADRSLSLYLAFGSGAALLTALGAALAVASALRQRRRAEEAARLQALIEGAPVKMWIERPDGAVESTNAAWRDYTGQGAPPQDLDWTGTVHPEDRSTIGAERLSARAAGERYAADLRLRRASDDAWRWHRVSMAPLRADGSPGAIWAWIGTAVDVHDIREAEAAIADREARLRSVVDTAADGILVASAEGRIISANPAALRLFGYATQQELEGQPLGVLVPQSEAVRHDRYLAAHRSTGQARAVGVPGRPLMGRRRDGTEFPIELSVGSFQAGAARFFTGVVRDVTRRVAAEEALRRQAERRALLLDLSRAILKGQEDEAGLAALVFDRVAPVLGADLLFNFTLDG